MADGYEGAFIAKKRMRGTKRDRVLAVDCPQSVGLKTASRATLCSSADRPVYWFARLRVSGYRLRVIYFITTRRLLLHWDGMRIHKERGGREVKRDWDLMKAWFWIAKRERQGTVNLINCEWNDRQIDRGGLVCNCSKCQWHIDTLREEWTDSENIPNWK